MREVEEYSVPTGLYSTTSDGSYSTSNLLTIVI